MEFFEQAFKEAYRRKPDSLREDFCGTFSVCCEWVKSGRRRTAVGVDLCGETLQWGVDNNLSKLSSEEQARIKIYEQDVRTVSRQKSDILSAQNFSFWLFKTRDSLREYFEFARRNLKPQGVMIMDMMGGGECYSEGHTEKRKIVGGKKGFSYHWEQVKINPVNSDCTHYIHFKFADGSKLHRAFEYEWRFWTIPEVRELLAEAGFSDSVVYWEVEDEDGNDTGEWAPADEAPNYPSWLCYIVAIK
ncbi:MAG: class I SAM-dependent methyltransferase [Pseudomonadota bacterium]